MRSLKHTEMDKRESGELSTWDSLLCLWAKMFGRGVRVFGAGLCCECGASLRWAAIPMFWRRGSGNVDCLVSSVVVDLQCCSVPWGVGLSRFRVGCAWRSSVLWIRILLCMQECRSVDLRWGRSRDCYLWCLLPFGEGRSRGWCRWCLLGVVLELDFVVGGGSVVVRGPVRRSSCANRHFGDRAVGERCRLVVFESGEMRAPDGDLQLRQFHDFHISNTSRSGCYISHRSVYFFPLPSFRHLESAVLQRHREASPGRSVSRSHLHLSHSTYPKFASHYAWGINRVCPL